MRACAALLVGGLAGVAAAQSPEPPPPPERTLAQALLALATAEEQEAWLQEHPDELTQAFLAELLAAGHAEASAGRFERAAQAAALVRDLAQLKGAALEVARSRCLAGRAQSLRGDYEAARDEFLACKHGVDALGRSAETSLSEPLRRLGVLARERGELDEAVDWCLQALQADERAGNQTARSLQVLGTAYSARGDFALAAGALTRALDIERERQNTALFASLVGEMAQIYYYQGHWDLAHENFQRALDLAATSGGHKSHGVALMNMSVLLTDEKRFDEALQLLDRARQMAEQDGARGELAKVLKQVGSTHYARGHYAAALTALDEAAALSEEVQAGPVLINALRQKAVTLVRLRRPGEAQGVAERAAALAEAAGSLQQLRWAKGAIGEAREALGDTEGALRAWRDAMDVTERLRERVAGGDEERQGFFGMHIRPYREVLRLELLRGRTHEAFRVAETAHARSLLDVLKVGQAQPTTLAPRERDEERRIEERLARAARRAHPAAGPGTAAGVTDEEHAARIALDELRVRLYTAHPELRLLRGEIEPLTPEAAAALLHGHESALLLFSVGPARTHLMVLSRATEAAAPDLAVFTIEVSSDVLGERVTRFRERLEARDLDLLPEATGLYELLLGQARSALAGRTRLVIVPDGVLWELPFQALQPRRGRYLLQDATLNYAPSLTALAALQDRPRRRAHSGPELLAIGDPLYAPSARMPALRHTGRQARALARLFGLRRGRAYVGASATEGRLKAEAAGARLLHVAAHGVLDGTNPMLSFLALASEPRGATEDGRLEARELLRLDLDADLVSLSACETARGRVSDGEGVIGLAWAALLGGARGVVVSQWRVDADSTERLMLGLYRRIETQRQRDATWDAADALRRSALELLADPRTRHPFYWAGFIQVGAAGPGPAAAR